MSLYSRRSLTKPILDYMDEYNTLKYPEVLHDLTSFYLRLHSTMGKAYAYENVNHSGSTYVRNMQPIKPINLFSQT